MGQPRFLHLLHLLHAVAADDIHFFCGPDALAAAGAGELSCAARPLFSGDRRGAWGIGGGAGAEPRPGDHGVSCNLDFAPSLLKCIFKEVIAWSGVPAVGRSCVNTGQTVGLSNLLEFLVVIGPAPADLLDPVLPAVKMDHFVDHGVNGLLNGIAQDLRCNVDFVGVVLRPFPDLGNGAVTVGAGLALYCNNGRRQLVVEKIGVDAVVDVLKLGDGAGHFGSLFHGVTLHKSYFECAARLRLRFRGYHTAHTETTCHRGPWNNSARRLFYAVKAS